FFSGISVVLHSFPTRRSSDLLSCGCPVSLDTPFTMVLPRLLFTKSKIPSMFSSFGDCYRIIRLRYKKCLNGFSIKALNFQQSVRSEEHTSELQSRENLVCRLL